MVIWVRGERMGQGGGGGGNIGLILVKYVICVWRERG